MKPESSREAALFAEALEQSRDRRAAFLDGACRGDPALRRRIEVLLAAHDRADAVLPPPPDRDAGTVSMDFAEDRVEEAIGQMIGPYKVREKIGVGGCGVVYVAEQTAPVRRQVALKVIKLGMDTKAVVARFEAERQALALMDHPHIAKVLDAGATPSGRPYFVMELVRGIPITAYCDQNNLPTEERLRLFVKVCQAIQHAHQKGIIHRDIKPSNILVTLHDGVPVPKVIDFGIAKATEGRLTDATIYTQLHQFLGTPAYMSPEQAEMSGLDIDTRSDIYSLGILLYELLTGTTPYNTEKFLAEGIDALRKVIREQEPARPSTRFSSLAEAQRTTTARRRAVEPSRLTSILRGDLDWIVLKCLEKDRTRRYETANGLAMDLTRYMEDQPVTAAAPTSGYKLRKFVRRNRGPVLAAGLVVLALLAGITGTTWGWIEARRQQRVAEQETAAKERARLETAERAEGERLAKLAAEQALAQEAAERAYAEAVADFVIDDILALTSVEGQARFEAEQLTGNATLRELLDRAAKKLDQRDDLPPAIEAELHWIIGVSYRGVGESRRALPYLERALERSRSLQPPDPEATFESMNSLGVACLDLAMVAEALRLLTEAEQFALAEWGPTNPRTLQCRVNLADARGKAGRIVEAVRDLEAIEQDVIRHHPENHDLRHAVWNSLAMACEERGALPRAHQIREELLEYCLDHRGPAHPNTLHAMMSLALSQLQMDHPDRAVALGRRAVEQCRAEYGAESLTTSLFMSRLAGIYAHGGKLDEALELATEAYEQVMTKRGFDDPETMQCAAHLALVHAARLEFEPESIQLRRRVLDYYTKEYGPDHPETIDAVIQLAGTFRMAGRHDEAIPLLVDAVERCRQRPEFAPSHPTVLGANRALAMSYRNSGSLPQAIELFEELLPLTIETYGRTNWVSGLALRDLASTYELDHRHEEALPLYAEALPILSASLPDDHPHTLQAMTDFAAVYVHVDQPQRAIPLLEEAAAGWEEFLGRDDSTTIHARGQLIDLYLETDEPEKALTVFAELPAEAKPRWAGAIHESGHEAADSGRWKEAAMLFAGALDVLDQSGEGTDGDVAHLLGFYIGALGHGDDRGAFMDALGRLEELARAAKPDQQLQVAGEIAQVTRGLVLQGKFRAAEPLARMCLALREQAMPEDWRTFNARAMLGAALLGQDRIADAEPLLVEGYQGMVAREPSIPAMGKPRVIEALQHLVALYETRGAEGDAAEAARYRNLLNERAEPADGA